MRTYEPVMHARATVGEALCGATSHNLVLGNPRERVDCKRCLAALARQKASVARASETKASRIPRTPGR